MQSGTGLCPQKKQKNKEEHDEGLWRRKGKQWVGYPWIRHT